MLNEWQVNLLRSVEINESAQLHNKIQSVLDKAGYEKGEDYRIAARNSKDGLEIKLGLGDKWHSASIITDGADARIEYKGKTVAKGKANSIHKDFSKWLNKSQKMLGESSYRINEGMKKPNHHYENDRAKWSKQLKALSTDKEKQK